jgi:hypothetical protein
MNSNHINDLKPNDCVTDNDDKVSRMHAPEFGLQIPLTESTESSQPFCGVNGTSRNEQVRNQSSSNSSTPNLPDINNHTKDNPAINQEGAVFAQTGDLILETFDTQDRDDKQFVKKCLKVIPYVFRFRAKTNYNRLMKASKDGRVDANTYLRKLAKYCQGCHVVAGMTAEQIDDYAVDRAKECYYTVSNMHHNNDTPQEMLEVLESIMRLHKIKLRKGKNLEGDIARYASEKYWNKKLRHVKARAIERISRHMAIVHRHSQIYITDYNLRERRECKRRTSDFLAMMEMENEIGDTISLKEASERNVSNPVNKRNELMCRLSGMEIYADKKGYKAVFVTITTPSRMHAVLRSGKANPKFDGTDPTQSHNFLCGQWAKSRASLARNEIDYFGMRVVEPHHDGTPHWHLLVFVKPAQLKTLCATLEHYALEVDGDELGASKHRFTVEKIDKSKGSAVGYIAKYIAKNIDGYGVDKDHYGKPANESAERICEWSGVHGIRQFQQFGGPSVTVWREARRIALNTQIDSPLLSVLSAADTGDWCAFIEQMGGANVKRKDCRVTIYREFIEEEGEYLEPIGFVIKGLCCEGEIYISRHHEWKLKKIDKSGPAVNDETAG